MAEFNHSNNKLRGHNQFDILAMGPIVTLCNFNKFAYRKSQKYFKVM
jgi:hypothetical protein